MLRHWFKGLDLGFVMEHAGRRHLAVVSRDRVARYARIQLLLPRPESARLVVTEETRELDGESWYRVEDPGTPDPTLWLRVAYSEFGSDDRMLLLIDAPRTWRITWPAAASTVNGS